MAHCFFFPYARESLDPFLFECLEGSSATYLVLFVSLDLLGY